MTGWWYAAQHEAELPLLSLKFPTTAHPKILFFLFLSDYIFHLLMEVLHFLPVIFVKCQKSSFLL